MVSVQDAQALVRRHYALDARASTLSGERDQNFLVRSADNSVYVLKISHPEEDMDTVRFQNAALAHVAAGEFPVSVPRVIANTEGTFAAACEVGGGELRIVRLLSYLEGIPLHETQASALQDFNLGAFLARLGVALADFPHARPGAALLWDLSSLSHSRPMIPEMTDPTLRSLVATAYDDAERHALPVLEELRAQPIHNDMNPYNVLMDAADPRCVRGMIDFGDMVRGPLVNDMAVGAAYRWSPGEHPLAGVARFLRGYDSVRGIEPEEIDLLFDLVRARLALTINLSNWQAVHFAHNRDYALRLQDELIAALTRVSRLSREQGRRFLREALS